MSVSIPLPFKLAHGVDSAHLSPNAGLLAVAGAFRSLGLPRCIESNLGERLSPSGEFSREQPSRRQIHTNATIAECLLLAQSGGGDCVEELFELSKDGCLSEGLNMPIPGADKALSFLRALGRCQRQQFEGRDPWQQVLEKSVFSISNKLDPVIKKPGEKVTICVETVESPETSRLVWKLNVAGTQPKRVVCVWRETDLVLSGALCRNPHDVIGCLYAALEIADAFGHSRIVFGGPECWQPDVKQWMHEQSFRQRAKTDGKLWSRKKKQIGYAFSAPLESISIDRLGNDSTLDWSCQSLEAASEIEWATEEFDPEHDHDKPKHLVLRQKRPDSEEFEYAMLVSNLRTVDGHLFERFKKGHQDAARAINDIRQLAAGSFPTDSSGDAGEGRFRLALLTYNVCSAIRQLVFKNDEARAPIDQFRTKLIRGVGRIAKDGGSRWLKLSQTRISNSFHKVRRQFPYEQKATANRWATAKSRKP